MVWPNSIVLDGKFAGLVPLVHEHEAELREAVKDGKLWKLWYTAIPEPDKMAVEIDRRLALRANGSMMPFAVIDKSTGKAVGMTTYMNIDANAPRVEIGSTWYRTSVQRTGINTECKILLLTHAFEELECLAVEFRTSFFNHQSRKAIERLGAKLDGVLRNHSRHTNGTLRDTCVYSITAAEWPSVKSHLIHKLSQY